MSTTIDNRVVEMQFNNKQFESGVSTSMSTIDKLKQKLNILGSSKGLENISASAKKVDFSGLNKGIETVQSRFSALEVMGVTALANITNSAVNAGKNMISALTIDPIKTGYEEYETQINAIQTILANTQKEGTNVERVNSALDELNKYADMTIYNFTEMTRNIGTFTAAGVKLDTSVNAIKGIANLAAISGSTSQQASTAMYQLSQALAAGKVQLMDWNSVVNAGMGGQVFQDALVRTSEHLKTGAKEAIKTYGSFRESLTKGEWLTTEVLTETLNQIAGTYNKADLMAQGYTEKQAEEIVKLANTAVDAATKVKTFTQLWDTLKEAVQSGWGQSWRIIVGDFEEAKELFTELSDFFGGIIGKSSDRRNAVLEGALSNNPFSNLVKRIESVTGATETMKKVTQDYGKVVDKVINRGFGDGKGRFDALAKAGYDWAYIQNLVNERLGDSTRHATDFKESQDELNKTQTRTIEDLIKMSDAQLKNLGFTKSEVEAFRDFESQSKKTGIPIKDLVKDMDQLNGRTLLINSFKNAGKGLVTVFNSISKAWRETFYGDATEEDIVKQKTESLYNMITALHKFSTNLKVSKDTADEITRTFKGLFAIIDILTTITGGGFTLAFKLLTKLLGAFDVDLLSVTASLGDAIVKFRDFLFDNELINKGFDTLADGIVKAAKVGKQLYDAFKKLPQVQKIIKKFKDSIEELKDIDLSEVADNIMQGLQNGLLDGAGDIPGILMDIGMSILDAICKVLGIHSPSVEMYNVGKNAILGLINGLKDGISALFDMAGSIASGLLDIFDKIPWSKIFAFGVAIAMAMFVKQIADAISSIASVFEGFGDIFENAGKVLKSFSKVLNGIAWNYKAKAMQKFAIAIGILVVAVIALSKISAEDLAKSVTTIAALSAILVALAFAVDKMSESSVKIGKGGASIDGLKTGLLQIGATLLLLAYTVKIVGGMDTDQAIKGFVGLTALMVEMGLFLGAIKLLSKTGSLADVSKVGSLILKLSIALLLMVGVVKLASGLSSDEMLKGAAFATGFAVFVKVITEVASTSDGKISKVGGLMVKMAIAMGLMVGVIKLINILSAEDMVKGVAFATGFVLFVKALVNVTYIGSDTKMAKVSGLIMSISASMLLMVGVVKLIGLLNATDILKGVAFVAGFLVFVKALINITTIGSDKQLAKVGITLLAMSVSIGILAAISVALSLIDVSALAKGVTVVALLGAVLAGMIYATKGANNVKGNLIVMTIAIGVMAGAIAALSMIDSSKLMTASASISMMMSMFALIAKSSGTMGAVLKPLILMTTAIGILAGVLYLLSGLDVKNTLEISASLSLLMMTLAVTMQMISTTGSLAMSAIAPMAGLTLILGGIALIIGLLAKTNPKNSLEIATSLSVLLLSMSAVTAILSAIGPVASGALSGVAALAIVVTGVGLIIAALGALVDKFPALEKFIDSGIPILEKIGYGLGSFLGNIVGGFSEGATSGLPGIADNLSLFMDNLSGFINGAKSIGDDSLTGIKNLAEMILMLSGANIVDKVSSMFFGGDSSMETLSQNLDVFASAAIGFSNKLKNANIDESAVESAVNVGKMMAELQNSVSMSGPVISFFSSNNDLGQFGTQLVAYGNAITSFSNTLVNNGGVNEAAVESAANAGSVMASLQSNISMTGTVISFFANSNDLGQFGLQLVLFGKGITDFSNTIVENGGVNQAAVEAAANAGNIMTALQSSVSMSGPVLDFFAKGNNLAVFGSQLVAYGKAIADFSKSVTGDNAINPAAIEAAANAGSIMANLQNAIPTDKWFDGKVSLEDFGDKIKKFGEGLVGYSKKVSEMDSGSVGVSITLATRLVGLAKSVVNVDVSGIGDFKKVTDIGTTIKSYGNAVADINIDSVSKSISSANKLKSFISSLSGLDTSGVSSFKTAINNLGKIQIGNISKAFSGSSGSLENVGSNLMNSITKGMNSKKSSLTSVITNYVTLMQKAIDSKASSFKTSGEKLMSKLVSGINNEKTKMSSSISSAISSSVTKIRSYYGSFYSAGTHLGSGLVIGINSKQSSVYNAGYALGQKAVQGEKDGQKSHSPSKLTIQSGKWLGEGLVIGIKSFGNKVYNAAYTLGDKAAKSMSDAIRTVSDFVNGDIDVNPTISPVLDLSEVRSGVGSLNGLLNGAGSLNIMSSLGSINASMNSRRQNGGIGDVVSAIDKLRKDLGKVGNTTYNSIERVTYDDGSDVSDAIETLVRAAIVGGRK